MNEKENALARQQELVNLARAEGRVCAQQITPYPPGVPVVAPGERICKKSIAYLDEIGYNTGEDIAVVRQSVCVS